MLKVSKILVRSFDIDYLDVYWEVEDTNEDVNDYNFTILRSENQFGPFQELVGPFRNSFHVRDNTVRKHLGFFSKLYYRVKVTKIEDSTSVTYPEDGYGISIGAEPDLMALEMARLERLQLMENRGRLLWLFPTKKFGTRCSCYDTVMARQVRSNCPTCYDTSYVGGYDAPLKVWGQVVAGAEVTARTTIGEISEDGAMIKLPNYPEISEGWIVVESENIRWRINNVVNKVEKSRALVRQEAGASRIESSDIAYSLPINESNVKDLIVSPPRNFTNPRNPEAAGLLDSALELFS